MPPNPNTGNRPNDLKTSDLCCNPDWKTDSGGRHHIFLFDGTWNDSTGMNPADFTWDNLRQVWISRADPTKAYPPIVSNVAKTNSALAPDGPRQITHYFRGVGNDDENDSPNRLAEGAFSEMEEHTRNAAYCDFLRSYCKGDQISILGFSRGAATARLFAQDLATRGFVDEITIGSRYRPVKNTGLLRHDVWDLTTRWSKKLISGDGLPIAFLGLWDTVATSISAKPTAWRVPDTVARCVHCLAIDETRNSFTPTLLQYPKNRSADMKEVWFPGCHSDIGGSYYHDALARQTLKFVWKNWDSALASQQLTGLQWRSELWAQYVSTLNLPWLRHQEGGFTAKVGGVSPRDLTPCSGGKPRVHPSVEEFVQRGGLQFCVEGEGFPPECVISSPIYQPAAYPGAGGVEIYDDTTWA
ncbi:MAG TPA: DUF2235 domain-containing protein [Opitutaceae bacterium]|nr:DUF2235 domain-containing protein [Opitutaceae bacterium]